MIIQKWVIDLIDIKIFWLAIFCFKNADSAVKDLKITGYSIDDGEIIDVSSSSLISGNILYTDTKVKNIKVYIEWSDTENDTMDNKADTEARNKQAKLDVKLNFKQIAN